MTQRRLFLLLAFVVGGLWASSLHADHLHVSLSKDGTQKTLSNTQGVRAIQDSLGTVRVDTTGWGRMLEFNTESETWTPKTDSLWPGGSYFRESVSLYYVDGTATEDSLFGSGYVLDLGALTHDGVTTELIDDQTILSGDVDSTDATFTFADVALDAIELRQAPAATSVLTAPYGTADNDGVLFDLTGSSATGTGLLLTDWAGWAINIDRPASIASSKGAIHIDMSDDTDSTSHVFAQSIDYAGVGRRSGIDLVRASGTRNFDDYGVRVTVTGSATTPTGKTAYGGYFDVQAGLTGTGKNVAVYAEAPTTNSGLALEVVGDASFTGNVATTGDLTLTGDVTITGNLTVTESFGADSTWTTVDVGSGVVTTLVYLPGVLSTDSYYANSRATTAATMTAYGVSFQDADTLILTTDTWVSGTVTFDVRYVR